MDLIFDEGTLQLAGGGALVAAILWGAATAAMSRKRRLVGNPNLYGSARFMTEDEVRCSGLWVAEQPSDATGVYLGCWRDRRGTLHYLRDASNGHVLICGPTRAGKGISCILPTLLSWGESALINDEKGELWAQTFPWRAQLGRVVKWEPGALTGSASWNPFSEVRLLTPYEVADAQNVALMLIDVQGQGLDRLDHWQKASFQILTGCILHELYVAHGEGRNASLADVAGRFSDPGLDTDTYFEQMRDNAHSNGAPHPVVSGAARAQLERSERERAAVVSTLLTHLMLFSDEIVCANTSRSDFTLADLADSPDGPMSIYVVTTGAQSTRLRPLVRLFLVSALRRLMSPEITFTDGRQNPVHRHRTLMMLDEFSALGRLDQIETGMARCAGYGVKVCLAIQDLSQLTGIYGSAQSVVANCHTRAFFPTNDLATAKILSESTGTTTILAPHIAAMGKRFGALNQVTKSVRETARPLLTPGEILTMRPAEKDGDGRVTEGGEMLIFCMGQSPIRAVQMLYFRDDEFAARARVSPPVGAMP